jgi:hypothetical protein
MADGFWQPFGQLTITLFVEGYLGGGSILMAQICTFAETANVNYCLSFADQGKQPSVFCLQKTNRSRRFHSPFAHRANGRMSFVHLQTD